MFILLRLDLGRLLTVWLLDRYLKLIHRLITMYTLEPAGSHGVWGLDDHSFIPYILGSAQLSPAISETDITPTEGSLPGAPDPGDVAKASIVARERQTNIYFSAIGFIYDVKRGPFWEHSPMLFDISGIRDGWGKINKVGVSVWLFHRYIANILLIWQGMLKMYNAEVLSKFPVVQHFHFGALFRWEPHPDLVRKSTTFNVSTSPGPYAESKAPSAAANAGSKAPWAAAGNIPPSAQTIGRTPPPPMFSGTSRAPWATGRPGAGQPGPNLPTRAPWADKKPGA